MMTRFGTLLVLAVALGCGHSSSSSQTGANGLTVTPTPGSVLPEATVGAVYTQTITVVSGGAPPFQFTLLSGPPGMTVSTIDTFTAALGGTPGQPSSGTVAVQLTDANVRVTNLSWSLQVVPASPSTLTISPSSLPAGQRPQPYNVFLSVTGGIAPFTWSASGTLPPGLALGTQTTATDNVSGTPTTAGSFAFTVTVTDSTSPPKTGTASYTININ